MSRTVGQIESTSGQPTLDIDSWIAMIDLHPRLQRAEDRPGVNPFTKKPTMFRASPTSGIVKFEEKRAGNIYPAEDGTPVLIVDAEEGCEAAVLGVAEEVAASLGYRFARSLNDLG
jgi:hypothetical protein